MNAESECFHANCLSNLQCHTFEFFESIENSGILTCTTIPYHKWVYRLIMTNLVRIDSKTLQDLSGTITTATISIYRSDGAED